LNEKDGSAVCKLKLKQKRKQNNKTEKKNNKTENKNLKTKNENLISNFPLFFFSLFLLVFAI
jgi:Ca2+/Na+ antiporter